MAKFSVKKPMTVFVAVIAVLVLGFVSFTGMTPDLLPSIDLPYILISTPYPGATPERVETEVTKPMEQSLATLDDIVNISSTSSENSSMITLEFSEDVNMEAITVDILQRISQIEGYWDEMVGTPIILKLNPNMLPIMVSAVNMEGMDYAELSYFVNNDLAAKLDGIEGVASISYSGLLEEQIQVLLNDEKMDETNLLIAAAVSDSFAEARLELEDAQAELNEQIATIDEQIAQLDAGIAEMANQLASGSAMLDEQQRAMVEGQMELTQQISDLETQRLALVTLQSTLTSVKPTYAAMHLTYTTAKVQVEGWTAVVESLNTTGTLTAENETFLQNVATPPLNAAQMATLTAATAQSTLDAIKTQTQWDIIAPIMQQLEGLGIASEADLDAQIQATAASIAQMDAGIAQMNTLLTQLDSGQITLDAAMLEMEKAKISAQVEISGASSQLTMADAQLAAALTEVEQGLESLAEAETDALDATNLYDIITTEMLAQILTAQNFSMPAGYVQDAENVSYLISVGENITSQEELSQLVILDLGLEGLEPIKLSDVADVGMIDNSAEIYANINGQDGVLISFNKQSTYATATVSDSIRAEFEKLSEEYPGLEFSTLMDQGDYIYLVINAIMSNLIFGALFAIIILFLFLRDLRPTFITLCSIPISVVFAISLMYFSGITLNIISMSGLAVAVGMLVDNSVVVIENIYRLRNIGVRRSEAAIRGAIQVAGALFASTLTTVSVFLPIVFVEGLTRQLFTDFALTMGYALLASLIVALTLVPAMSSKLLKKTKTYDGKIYTAALSGYKKSLIWVLGHKALVLILSLVFLVGSIALVLSRGFSFMPDMGTPQLSATLQMPKDTTLEDASEISDDIVAQIQNIEGVEIVGAMSGGGGFLMGGGLGGGSNNVESISLYIVIGDSYVVESSRITDEIAAISESFGIESSVSQSGGMSADALAGSGVSISLYGDDLDLLQSTAKEIATALREVEGTMDVSDGIGEVEPEIRFVVDKDKAMEYGLTTAQVYAEIAAALTTENASTTLEAPGETYDVIVAKGTDTLTPTYIRNYSFTVTDREGEEETVYLRDIADIVETETKTSIARDNQRRYINISTAIQPGYNVSLVAQDIETRLAQIELPPGMSIEYGGENESIMASFNDLVQMLLLGLLLVYLIMVAQFQSLKNPFIVMFTIPLAFTGGMLALLITGMELSVIALIGFVMLVGIIVNNGIVLVDYIALLREEGKLCKDAVVEAGLTRLRPILMTSLTTILGLSVMAIGIGTGSEMMQPIAIVAVGGLIYATILTLYVVPAMYYAMNRKEKKLDPEDMPPTDNSPPTGGGHSPVGAIGEGTALSGNSPDASLASSVNNFAPAAPATPATPPVGTAQNPIYKAEPSAQESSAKNPTAEKHIYRSSGDMKAVRAPEQ